MDFKNYLKLKREEKNLSMNKLGVLSGVSAMYISQIEGGRRVTPSPKILEKLAEGLNVPYEDLMIAAGYIPAEEVIEELQAQLRGEDIETRTPMPKEAAEEGEDQFELSYILDINHKVFFQDRLLTNEEKAKIKSVIEIVLKD
ncbi:helix-turn-helix domain-containing protein [Fredinandcohnia onubensis]|uniref:helix-turn-helix domain-containing protein n=1 Tax=Fredinandcohnia onubensis TaxID=1571209 RepID=UPI000C0BE1C1|nr:helix-turn-helix transcriptional regulator [Fredinandcohnia onubensis]